MATATESILKRFDLDKAVDRVHHSLQTEQTTSKNPKVVLSLWLALLPREVTSKLDLALQQAIPFMPPDFTPEVMATANQEFPYLTQIDIVCVCLHFAMQCQDYSMAAALIYTIDRALYRFGRSKPLLQTVTDLLRVSPTTAVAPQVTLRRARVQKDEGDLNGALRVLHTIISREDGWQYQDERQYQDTKAACLHVKGQIYHNLELWHSAIPPLVEGFRLFRQVQDRKGIGSCLHVLSRCLCRLQQQQYEQFRRCHPDVFEEEDACYEGYRQGQAAVCNVQHTEDKFFVVKHQLVADESLLMFAVQNPCPQHFQQRLRQILEEIQISLGGYKAVQGLQNVESFVEFVRAVFLASLVLFHSCAQSDKERASKLEMLSLKLYTFMCSDDKERSQPSSTKQNTHSTSFKQTSESVGFMNGALALLGLPTLQWEVDDDDTLPFETSSENLSDSKMQTLNDLDEDSIKRQKAVFSCDTKMTKSGTEQYAERCERSQHVFSGSNHDGPHLTSVNQPDTKANITSRQDRSVEKSKQTSSTDGLSSEIISLNSFSILEQTNSSHLFTSQQSRSNQGIPAEEASPCDEDCSGFTGIRQDEDCSGFTGIRQDENCSGFTGIRQDEDCSGFTGIRQDQDCSGFTGIRKDKNCSEFTGIRQDEDCSGFTGIRQSQDCLGFTGIRQDEDCSGFTGIRQDEDCSGFTGIRRDEDCSGFTVGQDEDSQQRSLRDGWKQRRSGAGFCSGKTDRMLDGDDSHRESANASQPVRPQDTPNKRDLTSTSEQNEFELYVMDHANCLDLEGKSRNIWSRTTNLTHNNSPGSTKAGHTDSMSKHDLQRDSAVTVESSARASTFPTVSRRRHTGRRRRGWSQLNERYVGLALSREELRAATWPALSPEAESSLEEQDYVEEEEDENLDALSISTNSSTSSKMLCEELTNSEHDTRHTSVSADCNPVTEKILAVNPLSHMYSLPTGASLPDTENAPKEIRHICTSCNCSSTRYSTVDQEASTKCSKSETAQISVSSLLPENESDILLSNLQLDQEHHDQQQTQQVRHKWKPSQDRQVHRAVLLMFNVWTGQWRGQSTLIHMGDALPLANINPKGTFRDAFLVSFLHQGEPLARYVGKKYRKRRPLQQYMRDVTDQTVASYYVTLFNEALSQHQTEFLTIHFLPAFHLQVLNEEGQVWDWLNVEPYMDGRYHKITNNASYISPRADLASGMQVATAFSHFSYVCSEGRYMVVDLQGCVPDDNRGVIYLTDPVLHSTGTARTSTSDRHEQGMADFFDRVHIECNAICRLLQLDKNRPLVGGL